VVTDTRAPTPARVDGPASWWSRWPTGLAGLVAVLAGVALPGLGGDGGGTLGDVLSVLLVLVAARELWRGRAVLSTAGGVVFSGVVVAVALATVGTSVPEAGLAGPARWLQLLVLVPLAVGVVLRRPEDLRVFGGFVLGAALVQGGIGVEQYLTGTGALYDERFIRAVGTFGAANISGMSVAVALGLLVAIAALLASRTRRSATVWLLGAAFLAVPLLLSFSRGTWTAVAVGCAAMVLARSRRLFAALTGTAVLVGVLLALVGAQAGDGALSHRISSIGAVTSSDADQSVDDRYELWAAATTMWAEHPVLGVGIRGFPAFRDSSASLLLSSGSDTQDAGKPYVRQPLTSPHSQYLLALSEGGIVGAAALGGLLLALLLATARRTTAAVGTPDADVGLAALGVAVFLVVDFVYGDLGGSSTLVLVTALGGVTGWALVRPGSAT
jgi:O-antigen ligase